MVPSRSFGANQEAARRRPSPLDLSTTAEYHQSLRNDGREGGRDHREGQQQQQSRDRAASKFATRRWMPIRPKTSDASTRPTTKSSSKKGASKRDTVLNPSLQLSRQEVEEFETLPIAVRRKYFSTLERLRFAQTSSVLVHDNSQQKDLYTHSPRSFTFFSPDKDQQSTNNLKLPDWSNRSQTQIYQTHPVSTDCLPLNSSQRRLTRAEQVALAKSLRESVILDAADEAIYKIGRRASRHLTPQGHRPATTSTRPSMEAPGSRAANAKAPERPGLDAFYDSVRFLDGDEDLDLTLQLDDYHANLKEDLPMATNININNNDIHKGQSFRRHLSINKIPFGRPSFSTNRATHHNVLSPPTSPTSPAVATMPQQPRRKSRALSLINTRHVAQEPTTVGIDPAAAHYRDPEARAKLRVYLASPQKFDEAVEFGFPSGDGLSSHPTQEESPTARSGPRDVPTRDSSEFKTFFSDDRSSIYSDEMSLPDPESPRTPSSPAKTGLRSDSVAGGEVGQARKPSDGYALLPAASREMTLRMTLTRSDLRDCEDQMYGWQKASGEQVNKPSSRLPSLEELPPPKATLSGDNGKPKESLEAFFAALDEEDEAAAAAAATTESGVVKRFWNKMRRAT